MSRLLSAKRRTQIADAGKAVGGHTATALHRAFGDRAHGRVGILLYHRVVPYRREGGEAPFDTVSPARFRAQLEGLLERGFHFAPLSELVQASGNRDQMPARTAVITFDDGFANVYEHALPILTDLGLPATVFVVTGYIGSGEPFPFDAWGRKRSSSAPATAWRPLDWSECRMMQDSGLVEIGSHTHTHADFRGKPGDFEHDLSQSLEALTRELGHRVRPFAFPFGNVRKGFAGADLAHAARRTGVTCGLTTEIELADPAGDPFTWGRVEAVQSDSAAVCAAKLSGWYNWMGIARSAFQRVASR